MTPRELTIKLAGRISRERYRITERWHAGKLGRPPLNILITPHALAHQIADSFKGLPDQIEIAPIGEAQLSRFDIVVPLAIADVLWAGRHRELLSHCLLPIPDPKVVALCNDKLLFHRKLVAEGFANYLPVVLTPPLSAPFVLKKRESDSSRDTYLVETRARAAELESLISSDDYFCQSLVSSPTEYATHMIIRGGQLLASLTIEYVAHKDIYIDGSKNSVTRRVVRGRFDGQLVRILQAIGFEGLCCFDYKLTDGQLRVFEINPRLGGSLAPYFFSFVRRLQPQ